MNALNMLFLLRGKCDYHATAHVQPSPSQAMLVSGAALLHGSDRTRGGARQRHHRRGPRPIPWPDAGVVRGLREAVRGAGVAGERKPRMIGDYSAHTLFGGQCTGHRVALSCTSARRRTPEAATDP